MYSYKGRLKASGQTHIKFDFSATATIRELGYPHRETMREWLRELSPSNKKFA